MLEHMKKIFIIISLSFIISCSEKKDKIKVEFYDESQNDQEIAELESRVDNLTSKQLVHLSYLYNSQLNSKKELEVLENIPDSELAKIDEGIDRKLSALRNNYVDEKGRKTELEFIDKCIKHKYGDLWYLYLTKSEIYATECYETKQNNKGEYYTIIADDDLHNKAYYYLEETFKSKPDFFKHKYMEDRLYSADFDGIMSEERFKKLIQKYKRIITN